jgi:hypothetical protein
VGPQGVVLVAPAGEAALLLRSGALGWAGALALEGEVHALVATVLLRGAGLDEIGQDAEADPPDRERRQAAEGLGGEGHAVIGADPPGQTIRAEEALEDWAGLDQLGAGERLTPEQHPAVAVGHGEWEAVLAVAELELALVIGGPHRIGGVHRGAGRSRRARAADAPAGGDQAQVLEAARDGRAHGPGRLGPAIAHQTEQLPGAPVGMALMGLEQALEQHRIERRRRAVRAPRLIGEARGPEGIIAGQEFVAGFPADAVRGTELGDRDHPAPSVTNEWLTELHGDHLLPRHRILLEESETWR